MGKVLWFNIPAYGHINPTLPVAAELRRRGHEVTYYCTDDTRASIERSGARFAGYPAGAPTMREIADGTKRLVHPGAGLLSASRELAPFAEAEIQREAPDLVVFDQMAVWAGIASRRTGTPAAATFPMLVLGGSPLQLGFRNTARWVLTGRLSHRAIERQRARLSEILGADAVRHPLFPLVADTNIVFVSPELHPASSVVDGRFALVGPSLDERTREAVDWTAPPGNGPLVYVSLGTFNKASLRFYREVFAAFRDHPGRFVLYAGADLDLSPLAPFPANFVVSSDVPQLRILEESDAFVTHGGMGSVQEGLYHGVPQIIVPQQLEQLINGRRVAELGAGVVLGDQPPYGRVKAAALRRALDQVLADDAFRRRAKHLGADARAAGGYARAADELERMLPTA